MIDYSIGSYLSLELLLQDAFDGLICNPEQVFFKVLIEQSHINNILSILVFDSGDVRIAQTS